VLLRAHSCFRPALERRPPQEPDRDRQVFPRPVGDGYVIFICYDTVLDRSGVAARAMLGAGSSDAKT
jgi:hypothetical protein